MSSKKKYWSNGEELKGNNSIINKLQEKEFPEELPTDAFLGDKETLEKSKTSRRDFLKFVGFSTAAASLAACEGPVMKTVPYVNQPDRIVPGKADYYATTMANGHDFSSVLVKTREARPIRVDKNYMDEETGAKARVHASVLSLYDNERLQYPLKKGKKTSWKKLDKEVAKKLQNVSGELVLLSRTFASPSIQNLLGEFSNRMGGMRHVVYDNYAEDGILNAFQALYGERAMPNYDFSKAEAIVSVGADFLGDWQGGHHDIGYAESRIPKDGKMSKHIQFESNLTLTGSKADNRVMTTPSQQKKVLIAIYSEIVGGGAVDLDKKLQKAVGKAVRHLEKAGSGAIFTTGLSDADAQILALKINEALGSQVINTNNPRYIRQGNVKAVERLLKDMKAGKIGGLLIADSNPVYSLPNGDEFKKAMKNVDFSLAFSMKENETVELCDYVATTPHYLESWGDIRFSKKNYSLMQPTIRPIFDTRQMQTSLMGWMGKSGEYLKYIQETWKPILGGNPWNEVLQKGVIATNQGPEFKPEGDISGTHVMSSANSAILSLKQSISNKGNFELCLYTPTTLGDGRQANNPWLQEMPDPITRASWDNYIMMSKKDADKMGVENYPTSKGAVNGSRVNITVDGVKLKEIPVMIQPGQAPGTIGLALGYGRTVAVQKEMQTGINAYPVYKNFDRFQQASVEKTEGIHEFACTQLQSTMAGREVIKETELETYRNEEKEVWNPVPETHYDHEATPVRSGKVDLWQAFSHNLGPHFNMSIDLNACTGCGACVIACQAENNVPVVGKTEVRKFRDMHWLRIDRYYSSADTFEEGRKQKRNHGAFEDYDDVETPEYENPEVVFQPVMCQHCDHAPCETVCPVNAITHGRQGQNQMIYNRCVGTRYCANNCPYKVRRFNWFLYHDNEEFDYNMNNDLGKMVLNPDVTVRSRGVMEKCSLCIQITQETILEAKREGRPVADDEYYTACSLACDKGAIEFGDVNNEDDHIVDLKNDDRMFRMLEYLGTEPNVLYQTMVRNTEEV